MTIYDSITMPVSTLTVYGTETDFETVTATPTSSTSYYDNGMWHTSYPVKSFPTQTVDWALESSMSSMYAYATAVPKIRRSITVEEAVQNAMINAHNYATSVPQKRTVDTEEVILNAMLSAQAYATTVPKVEARAPVVLEVVSWNVTDSASD